MDNFMVKMKEYLNMETELPYEEFDAFFRDFFGYLGSNYEGFARAETLQARFIVSILQINSADRSSKKGPQVKKFRKMSEKSKLWADALNLRLLKQGMTQNEIDEAHKVISDSM